MLDCLLSIAVVCVTIDLMLGKICARWPDQRIGPGTNPGLCAKLGQVNSGAYDIGLISWAANCHQAV